MLQESQPSEKFKIIESILHIVLKRYADSRGKNPKRVCNQYGTVCLILLAVKIVFSGREVRDSFD